MALVNPKDTENIFNESGWAARRKEAREWRALLDGTRGAAGGGDEAQVSPVQEVGAAQDDLRAGFSFTFPEATSAGW